MKWVYPTEFPSRTSPTVTNGLVFSGHMTAIGKPYQFNEFAAPTVTPLRQSGVIFALDKDTGKKLWEFNVGAPVGVGGPSIGHGMLFVTTGAPASAGTENKGGDVIAFGLPAAENQTQSVANTRQMTILDARVGMVETLTRYQRRKFSVEGVIMNQYVRICLSVPILE